MEAVISEKRLSEAVILLVDDQEINLEILDAHLKKRFNTVKVSSGREAIQYCLNTPPDLVLMDVVMPGMTGLETCRLIKSYPQLSDIPVIFTTSLSNPEDQTECYSAGGSDFIAKPIHPITLMQRVIINLTLKLQTDFLREQVYLDGLTSVYNRRYFNEHGQRCIRQSKRTQLPLSLLLIDVDHFKEFNDIYGHLSGDDCLKSISSVLVSETGRPTDVVCRYGGEEFACLLPETDANGAMIVAQKMCNEIQNLGIVHEASTLKQVTVSIGVAVIIPNSDDLSELVTIADEKLYTAKRNGRNQIVI